MNLVIMSGNLCKEVEVKTSSSGTAYLTNSIAVKREFHKDGEPESDFFSISIFGKSAEAAGKYLHKGSRIIVTGRIQNDSYTTKEGEKKTTTKVLVEKWEFAGGKDESAEKKDDFLNVSATITEELPF